MNTLINLGAPRRFFVGCVWSMLLLFASTAQANLIINDGATLTIGNSAELDVNCNDITITSGGTLDFLSGTIRDSANIDNLPGGTFNNNGTLISCLPLFSKAFSPATITSGEVSRLTFSIENPTSMAVSGLAFTDVFDQAPPINEVVVASPANASISCLGGAVVAVSGSGSMSFSGGDLASFDSCEVSVDVTSSVVATHINTTSSLSSSAGTSEAAMAELTVVAGPSGVPPAFSAAFLPDTIGPSSSSTLTFTVTNNSVEPITDIAFTNNLPAGVSIAASDVQSNCNFSTITALAGSSSISAAGGSLAPSRSCQLSVGVVSNAVPTPGIPVVHMNVSGLLSSSAGSSGTAADDLNVVAERPGFTKAFNPSSVTRGGKSRLTLTIDNTSNSSGVASLSVMDSLPEGMLIASPARASTDCGNATLPSFLTAVSGTNIIRIFVNGFLPSFPALDAGASCTISVDVITERSGLLVNVTDDLLAGGNSAGKAIAELNVIDSPLEIRKAFVTNPASPGSTTNIIYTVTNFNRDFAATDLAFTDDLGSALSGLSLSSVVANSCAGLISGAGTTSLSFGSGMLPPLGSCQVEVTVAIPLAVTPGAYPSPTGNVTAIINSALVTGNSASDILYAEPVQVLTKEFIDNPVNPGNSVIVEYTITNTSTTSSSTDIAFTDIFSTIFDSVSVAPVSESCGAGSNVVFQPRFNPSPPCDPCDANPARLELTGGTLAAGDSCTFRLTADLGADVEAGEYQDATQEVTAMIDGALRVSEPASDTLVVVAAPTLSTAFTPNTVAPGGSTTLEFTLEHSQDAGSDATAISFTNDLSATLMGLTASLPASPQPPCGIGSALTGSAGDTLLTLSGASLSPGTRCTFSVNVDIPAAAPLASYTNTTSTVNASVGSVAVTSAAASADLVLSSLSFDMEVIDNNPAVRGEDVSLRFSIENNDLVNDATGIIFTNSLSSALSGLAAIAPLPTSPCGPGSIVTGTTFLIFNGGSVAAGSSCEFDIQVRVPAGANNGEYSIFTSNLSAQIDGNTVETNPASAGLIVNSSVLSLSQTFINDTVVPGETTNLEFVVSNLDSQNAASSIAFTNDLDAALTGLTVTSEISNSCAATVLGLNTGLLSLQDISLAASETCTLRFEVQVPPTAEQGAYQSSTSAISGTINGLFVGGVPASDTLTVSEVDVNFSKDFTSGSVVNGGTTSLTYSIENSSASVPISEARFSDNLGSLISGLVALGLPQNDVCGPGSRASGTDTIVVEGINLPAGINCNFAVNIMVPATANSGTFNSSTTDLTTLGRLVAAPANDDLLVAPLPVFSKSFTPAAIEIEMTSRLRFTIDNSSSVFAATGLDFTDSFPSNLLVAATPNASTTCAGGTFTAVAGSAAINYAGGTSNASASCVLEVDVMATVGGTFVNTSGELTSSAGNSGTATATLTVDDDRDDDGVVNAVDNCPNIPNADQANLDGDADGDVCDADIDGDSVLNAADNCPLVDNTDQANLDGDSDGDVCDADIDGDSVLNAADNCPLVDNTDQANLDGDSDGDVCDADIDGDSVLNAADNCPLVDNTDQANLDGDSDGDACDADIDGDSVLNAVDNCPVDSNMDQANLDGDASGDVCDSDIDGDNQPNAVDNCPLIANSNQVDLDRDGQGNACDLDDDGDGMPDAWEIANGLNPLNSFDQRGDPDRDGFTNLEEFEFGTDPNVPDDDDNNNDVPDIVEQRQKAIVPAIIVPLLLGE